jgi:AcrR family transcriptional regulator
MTIKDMQREAALVALCEHVLHHGLGDTSLRRWAQAAGCSDRMLIYYFGSKAALLSAVLDALAQQLQDALATHPHFKQPLRHAALLAAMWQALSTPAMAAFGKLWVEMAALASSTSAADAAAVQPAAKRIGDTFLAWTQAHLKPSHASTHAAEATLVLATLDGLILMRLVGHGAAADAAVEALAR